MAALEPFRELEGGRGRARIHAFSLPLRRALRTVHGALRQRSGLLVELRPRDGGIGWGEASPIAGFVAHPEARSEREELVQCERALAAWLERWSEAPRPVGASRLAEDLAEVDRHCTQAPGALFAAETAVLDLEAQRRGVSMAALLADGAAPRRRVEVNALVAGETPDDVARQARAARRDGYRTLKLKVGALPLEHDEACLAALRDAVDADTRVRVDANGAWTEREAECALERLSRFGLEWIEQPVAAVAPDDVEALARLRERGSVPIAADESLVTAAAAARVLERRAADWLVLKPAACGGLRAARALAARARRAGLGVVVTSLLDAAVGRTAALHLAASLDGPLPACGLATGDWLADDVAWTAPVEAGALALPGGAGLGIHPGASGRASCGEATVWS